MTEMQTKREEVGLLKQARLQTVILCGIFVILLATILYLACQVTALKAEMQTALQAMDISELSETTDKLKSAADALSEVDVRQINATVEVLKDAAENLGDVDMEQLNGAVGALKDAAGKFDEVDISSINSLVSSLDTVATKMQNAVNAITGIFNR